MEFQPHPIEEACVTLDGSVGLLPHLNDRGQTGVSSGQILCVLSAKE